MYCSITGFGPGEDEDSPGYDFLVQARAGVMGITGPEDEPMKVGVAVADMVCGLYAATSILAALRARDATGEDTHLEVPLFESTLSWLGNRAQEYLVSGEDKGRMGNAYPSIVPYQTFDAADRPLAVAVGNDAQFERLCRAIGREDLSKDGRFATNPGRVENRKAMVAELERTFSGRTADEWAAGIRAAGVPCGPVNSLADVFSDSHVLSSGMLRNVEHPTAGALRMLASPLLIDGQRPPIRRPPLTLGEHAREIGQSGWLS